MISRSAIPRYKQEKQQLQELVNKMKELEIKPKWIKDSIVVMSLNKANIIMIITVSLFTASLVLYGSIFVMFISLPFTERLAKHYRVWLINDKSK